MLTAFKTPVGILWHCVQCAQPLASAVAQRSVCFCHSSSLSERISHPLLLQLFTAFLLNSTIRSSSARFHSSIIFLFLRSHFFLTSYSLNYHFRSHVELPTNRSSIHPVGSFLLPSVLLQCYSFPEEEEDKKRAKSASS